MVYVLFEDVSATSEGTALLNMAQPICSLWNC